MLSTSSDLTNNALSSCVTLVTLHHLHHLHYDVLHCIPLILNVMTTAHNFTSFYSGGLSVTEYPIWCEKEINVCINYMTSAVQIRRKHFLMLTDHDLGYHMPTGILMESKIQDL